MGNIGGHGKIDGKAKEGEQEAVVLVLDLAKAFEREFVSQ